MFTVENIYLPLIKLFTVNNYYLPFMEKFTVNKYLALMNFTNINEKLLTVNKKRLPLMNIINS